MALKIGCYECGGDPEQRPCPACGRGDKKLPPMLRVRDVVLIHHGKRVPIALTPEERNTE